MRGAPLEVIAVIRWSGFAIVDAQGRYVCYRRSMIPKLYSAAEQARNTLDPGQELRPVLLRHDLAAPSLLELVPVEPSGGAHRNGVTKAAIVTAIGGGVRSALDIVRATRLPRIRVSVMLTKLVQRGVVEVAGHTLHYRKNLYQLVPQEYGHDGPAGGDALAGRVPAAVGERKERTERHGATAAPLACPSQTREPVCQRGRETCAGSTSGSRARNPGSRPRSSGRP